MTTEMKRKTFKTVKAFIALAIGGICGIASAATYYVSTTGNDDNPGTQAEPFRTIQAALSAPNSWDGIVYIEAGTYQISSELTIRDNVNGITIRSVSGNPDDVTIDAQGNCRCFNCTGTEHYTYNFKGITFANGAATGDGGGVYDVLGSRYDDCVFRNCTATGNGGAIYSAASIRHINNVRIEGCSASGTGGGVCLMERPLEGIFNSTIENCTAGSYGGGVRVAGTSDSIITNCNISLNTCAVTGGAGIYAQRTTILNCTVTNNVCNHSANGSDDVGGSGIRLVNYGTVDGCLIRGNSFGNIFFSDTGGGSAVWLGGNGSSLLNSAIIGNIGPRSVAFQNRVGGMTVSNCLFKANVSQGAMISGYGACYGGMLYFRAYGNDTVYDSLVTNCRFIDNTAVAQGGLVGAQLAGNTAATLRIRNCLMAGNVQTASSSGIIYANGGTVRRLELENCTVVSNKCVYNPVVYPENDAARSMVKVSGCAIMLNTNPSGINRTAFDDNYKASENITYCCANVSGMGESNRTYDSTKPLFEDIANGNFRPAKGSQLLDGVPVADWMGDGSKNSKSRDLGTGYEIRTVGTFGVDVAWTDTVPRRYGDAADIGCSEYWSSSGLSIFVR